jgi:hypothetical protein
MFRRRVQEGRYRHLVDQGHGNYAYIAIDEYLACRAAGRNGEKCMHIVAKFYETYNICDVVSGLLKDTLDHALLLEGFHCDEQWAGWLAPYEKQSVLHLFIGFVVRGVHSEQADGFDIDRQKKIYANFKEISFAIADLQPHKLPIEHAFEHLGIDHQTFFEFLKGEGKSFEEANADDIYEYMNEIWISAAYEDLMEHTVGEVFHVLFQNRELMMKFNSYVSGIMPIGGGSRILITRC